MKVNTSKIRLNEVKYKLYHGQGLLYLLIRIRSVWSRAKLSCDKLIFQRLK